MTPSERKRARAARRSPDGDGRREPALPRPRRRRLRRAVYSLLVVPALLALAAAAALVFYVFASVPLPSDLDVAPTVVYDVRGEEIGELQQQASRDDIALDEVPGHVIDAVLAAEDAAFYDHAGISGPGILRAAYTNVVHGEIRQGGSTVSQQYVKNLTGVDDDTLLRKLSEATLAVKLERRHSKDEILEMYLNSIYFGRGAYGIQAAAQSYFGVDAAQLTPEQGALLAGIIPAPSALDPDRDPDGARRRYDYVLGRLAELEWADPGDIEGMRGAYPDTEPARMIVARRAPYFLAMVEQELARHLGAEHVHRGLAVRTTLDLRMQDVAERTYRQAFERLEVAPAETMPTGALVALDPETGGIRALVGGGDFAEDQYNLAVGGPQGVGRQPGSTFKVFGLAAWLEAGHSPDSLVDAPSQATFAAADIGTSEDWEPRNFDGVDMGRVTLREATRRSSNTAYAQLAVGLGPEKVLDAARRAGLDRAGKLRPDPALVLGTGEVTPLQLAEGYNTFAADGTHRRPGTIVEVTRDGKPLVTPSTEGREAFDEQVARHVSDVLEGVLTDGTGTAARLDRPAAGKTGTTSNHADAWFAGYTPDLTAVVWMGHRDDNAPMAGQPTGGGFPARLWSAFMSEALEGTDPTPFPEPSEELEVAAAAPECREGEEPQPSDPDDPDSDIVCVADEPAEEDGQGEADEPEPTAEDPAPDPAEQQDEDEGPEQEPPEPPSPDPPDEGAEEPPQAPDLEPPEAGDPPADPPADRPAE